MKGEITINTIKRLVNQKAEIINAPKNDLPTYSNVKDSHPFIEVDQQKNLHYVIFERGKEILRKTTNDLDELLYWIFCDVTFSLAIQFELENRLEHQDVRRIFFKKQEVLLKMLDPIWEVKKIEEHQTILKNNPFDDNGSLRVALARSLREKGIPNDLAWGKACEKYPLVPKLRLSNTLDL